MTIKTLFDPSKNIYRPIEKVIAYSASQESRLRAEIAEYIVTESIEDQFERLLAKMQLAMEQGGENEIGVWVSGFYGSGKSSFTKYLGLALDDHVQVDGQPFLKHLQDRVNRPTTKALLGTVARRFPAVVVLLDLASDMLAGATQEEISTVLYYKVLQWAGYSQNLKIAALERRLERDGHYPAFLDQIQQVAGVDWAAIQNDPLVTDSVVPGIAHNLYPTLFPSPTAFNTDTGDVVRFETDRVKEMIDIVRQKSGREHILFIIDEVGQYIGSRSSLILNLDGLAKNLKSIGDGKVWIFGTAQQTLTEDDPRAAFNSPELYKLKDRFPIHVDLESRDIKQICYQRLLAKSPDGERQLAGLFDHHGQMLRHHTKLENAGVYSVELDSRSFVNLYPFLPAHFDILLHLLGALARSTGGVGLRSAIKVIQDILIEGQAGQPPVAERPVGWLATTVTLYDALEKDIRRAPSSMHTAVTKTLDRFPDSPLHQGIAKTVALLQILDNLPVTAHNIAALLHPAVDAASQQGEVDRAIDELVNDVHVPFGKRGDDFYFFSEKINDIEQERAKLPLRSMDVRRIQNDALRQVFDPRPSTKLLGSRSVTIGLKASVGSSLSSLAGENEPIQLIVEFAPADEYDAVRTRLVEESRQRQAAQDVYMVGRVSPEMEDKAAEIYRCQEIVRLHRNDLDQEVRDYCTNQTLRAEELAGELQRLLQRSLGQGSFVFRGQMTPVDTLDADPRAAATKLLADVAEQVFERYAEAPHSAETGVAEKFLRASNLKGISSAIDPAGLVVMSGGVPQINRDHKALVSLRDYLGSQGMVEGKRLADHFTAPPFGWSPDTLRYLVAAMLVDSQIKLKVSGREIKVNGQQAIEALKNNNSFKSVGIALSDAPVDPQVLARAAARMTDLKGETIVPLGNEISRAVTALFPQLQTRYGGLPEKLANLGLSGQERLTRLSEQMAEILLSDASDAPQRLGAEDSYLYQTLSWAAAVHHALQQGLEKTITDLRAHMRVIESLPESGVPGQLRTDLADDLEWLKQRFAQDTFYQHAADFSTRLTGIQARIAKAVEAMAAEQEARIRTGQEELQRLPDWAELSHIEQQDTLGQLDNLRLDVSPDIQGLSQLLKLDYAIGTQVAALKQQVETLADERRRARLQAEREKQVHDGREKLQRTVRVPARLATADQLERLIQALQLLRRELSVYSEIEISFEFEE
jgi:hypothetical protein